MHTARAGLAMICLLVGLSAGAGELTREARGLGEVGLDLYTTHGESEWEIVFVDDVFNYGRSNLKFRDLDGEVYGLHAGVNLGPWFTLAGAYATGDLEGGPVTDSDVLSSAFFAVDNFLFSESKSDVSGDLDLYHIDLRLHMDALPQLAHWPARLYLFIGYQQYDEDLHIRQGLQTVIDEEPVSEPIDGLNSRYDFEWNAYRIGIGGVYSLTDTVTLRLQAAALADIELDGQGYWNLREDFRSSPPSFRHEGEGGSGSDLRAAIGWRPVHALLLEAGFWQIKMEVHDGRERLYLADGSREEIPLSTAETRRTGGFVTATLQF